MLAITIKISERLEAFAEEQAKARGLDDAETFLSGAIARAFVNGALALPPREDEEENFFATDPGGGIWYEDEYDSLAADDFDLAGLMDPPDEEEEALMQELIEQAAKWRRLH